MSAVSIREHANHFIVIIGNGTSIPHWIFDGSPILWVSLFLWEWTRYFLVHSTGLVQSCPLGDHLVQSCPLDNHVPNGRTNPLPIPFLVSHRHARKRSKNKGTKRNQAMAGCD
eukprot:scaffold1311_cov99-Cylindrotheca_fusiformis.AAC.12